VAYQALAATVRPMRTPLFGSLAERIAGFLATAVAARHYARNLLLDASTRYADLDARAIDELAAARRQLADSVGAVTAALAPAPGASGDHAGRGDGDGAPPARQYVRSASLFQRVADELPGQPSRAARTWRSATCSCSTAPWPRPPAGPASRSPTWTQSRASRWRW
jgi:hypothetical protein